MKIYSMRVLGAYLKLNYGHKYIILNGKTQIKITGTCICVAIKEHSVKVSRMAQSVL